MPPQPPFTLTPRILNLVAECSERVALWRSGQEATVAPQLRKENRIRSIQASLAIENNSLSIDQVTAINEGRPVIGLPREIQEVKNAIVAYDQVHHHDPCSVPDLLRAHGKMMLALTDDAGQFRNGGVGIYRGQALIHMAPPADRVPYLVADLFQWLSDTEIHPLIASSIVHYELEFIHPFSDGNGRIGRLWQTLILARWHQQLAYLPVETVIRENQAAYYQALGEADQAANASPFIEFMLKSIIDTLKESPPTDQVSDQVTDQVKAVLHACQKLTEASTDQLLQALSLKHKPTFRQNYLKPALDARLIEMTQPDSPRSPTQRYRLSPLGKRIVGTAP